MAEASASLTAPSAASAKFVVPVPENKPTAASVKKNLRPKLARVKSEKLRITALGKEGRQCWTVAAPYKKRQNEKKLPRFEIRVADSGFRVGAVYYGEDDKRHRPYLCYLSSQEWKTAQRGTFAEFLAMVLEKLNQRRQRGEPEAKIDALVNVVNVLGR